jgi:hypothetical protein
MALNPSRLGQLLATGDANAAFLKKFGGEIFSTFEEVNRFMALHDTQVLLQGAKSASFPVLGVAAAKWHTPGEDLILDQDGEGTPADYTSAIKHAEKEIFVDNVLTSSVLVPDLDRMKNHYDYRSKYASAIGRALALKADKNVLGTLLAAAKATETISGVTGRPTVTDNNGFATTAATLIGGIFDAGAAMDAVNVPSEGRYVCLSPTHYALIARDTTLVTRVEKDYGQDYGKGIILEVAGFGVVKTNNMPSTDLSAVTDSGALNDVHGASGIGYNGNWAKVVALCFQKEAIGTVKAQDLMLQSEYQLNRLADLMVASYVMGHGVLRPECCVDLSTV